MRAASLPGLGAPGSPAAPRDKARERAEALKSKFGVEHLARERGARVTPYAHGWRCDCPSCHSLKTVIISAHGETWRCGNAACGASGDLITFEEAATGASFTAACASLEARFGAAAGGRDSSTGELFGEGAGS
jgi:hypothetical protein